MANTRKCSKALGKAMNQMLHEYQPQRVLQEWVSDLNIFLVPSTNSFENCQEPKAGNECLSLYFFYLLSFKSDHFWTGLNKYVARAIFLYFC